MPNNSLIQYSICLNNKTTNLYCYLQDKKNIYLRLVDFNVCDFQHFS